MAAEIAYAEDRGERIPTVRDFIAQFRGLARTQVRATLCDAVGASATSLRDFFDGGPARIAALLSAVQLVSQPVSPRGIGVIDREGRPALRDGGGLRPCAEPGRPRYSLGPQLLPIGATVPFQGLSGLLDRQFVMGGSPVFLFLHLACLRLTLS
jgi:hypothetical protein